MPEGRYYIPTEKVPTVRGASGPRPHTWLSGPDILRHEQHIAWLKHKSQAAYRSEPHDITYEQWCDIWNQGNAWELRGRRSTATVLTRIDIEGAWTVSNVHIMTRRDHLKNCCKRNVGKTYNKKVKEQK